SSSSATLRARTLGGGAGGMTSVGGKPDSGVDASAAGSAPAATGAAVPGTVAAAAAPDKVGALPTPGCGSCAACGTGGTCAGCRTVLVYSSCTHCAGRGCEPSSGATGRDTSVRRRVAS